MRQVTHLLKDMVGKEKKAQKKSANSTAKECSLDILKPHYTD